MLTITSQQGNANQNWDTTRKPTKMAEVKITANNKRHQGCRDTGTLSCYLWDSTMTVAALEHSLAAFQNMKHKVTIADLPRNPTPSQWVGQKVDWDFSVTCFGNTQTICGQSDINNI